MSNLARAQRRRLELEQQELLSKAQKAFDEAKVAKLAHVAKKEERLVRLRGVQTDVATRAARDVSLSSVDTVDWDPFAQAKGNRVFVAWVSKTGDQEQFHLSHATVRSLMPTVGTSGKKK